MQPCDHSPMFEAEERQNDLLQHYLDKADRHFEATTEPWVLGTLVLQSRTVETTSGQQRDLDVFELSGPLLRRLARQLALSGYFVRWVVGARLIASLKTS